MRIHLINNSNYPSTLYPGHIYMVEKTSSNINIAVEEEAEEEIGEVEEEEPEEEETNEPEEGDQ